MRRASVAEIKARLSEMLAAVKLGEEVIVTERGKPVARLIPIAAGSRAQTHLAELVRAGLIRPPLKPLPKAFWEQPRPDDPTGRSLKALLEDRAEGR